VIVPILGKKAQEGEHYRSTTVQKGVKLKKREKEVRTRSRTEHKSEKGKPVVCSEKRDLVVISSL